MTINLVTINTEVVLVKNDSIIHSGTLDDLIKQHGIEIFLVGQDFDEGVSVDEFLSKYNHKSLDEFSEAYDIDDDMLDNFESLRDHGSYDRDGVEYNAIYVAKYGDSFVFSESNDDCPIVDVKALALRHKLSQDNVFVFIKPSSY
jgi:hypothetical protein